MYSAWRKNYICVAFFVLGTCLQLAESFTWTGLPANSTKVIAGSNVSLTWTYSFQTGEKFAFGVVHMKTQGGSSSIEVGHVNNGGVITNKKRGMTLTTTNTSATFNIHAVTRAHEAQYCYDMATFKPQKEKKCTRIEVLESPRLYVDPTTTKVNETGSLDLFCNATGTPAPNISWTKVGSGREISQKEHLIIDPVRREDSGTYVCTASSEAGNASAKIAVDVQYKPYNTSLVSNAVMDTITLGGSVTFNCHTDANPPANVFRIYHEGHLIAENASFTITGVQRSDGGAYWCEPSSELGTGQNATTILRVLVPTTSTSGPEKKRKKNLLPVFIPIFSVIGLVLVFVVGLMCHRKWSSHQDKKKRKADGTPPTASGGGETGTQTELQAMVNKGDSS